MIATRVAAIAMLLVSLGATAARANSAAAFERLSALVGEWEGTYQWSGGRDGSGTLRVKYEITGAGSAIVETLIMSGIPSMSSVYHRDGDQLRMTHYCAARNQPRLRTTNIDRADVLRFELVDVTGVSAANPGHVHAAELRFVDDHHITLRFTFSGGGPTAIEHIELTRVRGRASHTPPASHDVN